MRFVIHNHHRKERPLPLKELKEFCRRALPLVLEAPGPHERALEELEAVEVNLIGDEVMADLHGRFLGVAETTDIMTFPHGEIFISTDMAAAYASDYGHDLLREVKLYLAHGLLHLNGHEDAVPEEAEGMRVAQERILEAVEGQMSNAKGQSSEKDESS